MEPNAADSVPQIRTFKKHTTAVKTAHTSKNNRIVDANTQKGAYLSQTYEGKKHDKNMCDEEHPTFPRNSTLCKDTGFQGDEPEGVITDQPKKKPHGQELTPEDKAFNAIISRVRILVAHVMSGIKRCRIIKDIFRNTKEKFDDLVMEIACGLHNLRVESRYPTHDFYFRYCLM
jgi:hypothetical protein